MNALDLNLAQALKLARSKPITLISASERVHSYTLKVNLKLFGPSRDARGRFIRRP